MKPKTKSKTHGKAHAHSKTKAKARSSMREEPIGKAISSPITPSFTSPSSIPRPGVKACEEVEVGDIGGFGSPDELEEHEKRCNVEATQFCRSCGKNLCNSHYDLLHRDHDNATGHTTGQTMVQ